MHPYTHEIENNKSINSLQSNGQNPKSYPNLAIKLHGEQDTEIHTHIHHETSKSNLEWQRETRKYQE